jgi:hypothetical protein
VKRTAAGCAAQQTAHIVGSARGERAVRAPKVHPPFHARGAVERRDATHAGCVAPSRPPARHVRVSADSIVGALTVCKGVRACPAEPSGLISAWLACP